MPIYMDSHIIVGKNANFIAQDYRSHINKQNKVVCTFLDFWINENNDHIFFLIEASDKDDIKKLHSNISGLVPKDIIILTNKIYQSLLSPDYKTNISGESYGAELKIYNHPNFRVFLVTNATNSRLLQHKVGIYKSFELLSIQNDVIFAQVHKYEGLEIESEKEGIIACFTSSCQALECANSIRKELNHITELIDFQIGIHAGLPDPNKNVQYDKIIKFAKYLCYLGNQKQIVISSIIHDLFSENYDLNVFKNFDHIRWLFPCEGEFLEQLMDILYDNWQNPKLDISLFCIQMSMSKSHLYRKCKSILGSSLNNIIREFRLLKALEILNKTDSNISQTTFDTGFTNLSYFSKCFKNKFGIKPTSFLKNSIAT